MRYSHVIWDWNGTLLDDVGWCMETMNQMLLARGKKPLGSLCEYHRVFCFPIIAYYRNLGFDFENEPFETLAKEYIERYHGEGSRRVKLYGQARFVLGRLREKGASQIILSASAQDNLVRQMRPFQISHYFSAVLGISDIYAKSKVDAGKRYIAEAGIERAVLIGDTAHDYEVSQALGADCLLLAHGHQSRETLRQCNAPVLENLAEALNHIT